MKKFGVYLIYYTPMFHPNAFIEYSLPQAVRLARLTGMKIFELEIAGEVDEAEWENYDLDNFSV